MLRARTRMRGAVRILAVAVLVVAGCRSDPGLAGPPPRSCEGEPRIAPTAFAHLTRLEVGFALHDLFGADAGVSSRLPIDDPTSGFDVGTSTSPLLVEQYLAVAHDVAVAQTRDDGAAQRVTGCADASEACIAAYLARVGRRAFRRPLTGAQLADLLALYRVGAAAGFASGVRLLIEGIATSAEFLYHTEGTSGGDGDLVPLDAYERAARLAFLAWRSVPDDALLDDAAAGRLETEQQMSEALDRMIDDPRSSRMIEDFYRQWLGLDAIDAAITPTYELEQLVQMHQDIVRFADYATRFGTFHELLVPTGAGITPIHGAAPGEPPRGVLVAPGIMLALARADQTDPIHRGLFVRQRLLCQNLPPPPPGVIFSVPPTSPTQTTRERFAVHTSQASCAGCHDLMDPIGFGFEHYDHDGLWRTLDGTLPIDATGELVDAADATGPFDGADKLVHRLAESAIAQQCFARQWFRFSMQRVESFDDQCSLDTMFDRFELSGFRIRSLLLAIVRTPAFQHRRIPTVSP